MENRDEQLSADEIAAFARLERTMAIDPEQEERTVRALVGEGLIHRPRPSLATRSGGFVRTWIAIAAGLGFFLVGMGAERVVLSGTRMLHAASFVRAPMMGLGVACNQCEVGDQDGSTRWTFRTPPIVAEIWEQGPAALAGLRVGDTLIAIDGVNLVSATAGERLGRLAAGDEIQLSYRRGHEGRAKFTLAAASAGDSNEGEPLRFSGAVGANEIEVRGDRAYVRSPDSTGTLEIRGSNLVVKVRPATASAVAR